MNKRRETLPEACERRALRRFASEPVPLTDFSPLYTEAEEEALAEEEAYAAEQERNESFYADGLWTPYDAPVGGRL